MGNHTAIIRIWLEWNPWNAQDVNLLKICQKTTRHEWKHNDTVATANVSLKWSAVVFDTEVTDRPIGLNQKIVWTDVFGPEGELIFIFASVFFRSLEMNSKVDVFEIFEITMVQTSSSTLDLPYFVALVCDAPHFQYALGRRGQSVENLSREQHQVSESLSVSAMLLLHQFCRSHSNCTDWIRPGSCLGKHEVKRCQHQTLWANLILRQIQRMQLLLTWRMRQVSQLWIFWLETVVDKETPGNKRYASPAPVKGCKMSEAVRDSTSHLCKTNFLGAPWNMTHDFLICSSKSLKKKQKEFGI